MSEVGWDAETEWRRLLEDREALSAAIGRLRPVRTRVAQPGRVHDATEDCDGWRYGPWCPECYRDLCGCERAYGHDCEAP